MPFTPPDVSSCSIKVPFKVTMDLSGSFKVQVLEAEDYSLEAADKEFAGYLRDAVLDAFVVSKSNESGVAILDVSMNLGKSSVFRGEVKKQLEEALMNADGDNLETYLKDWANSSLLAELRANGIAAALEGDGLEELEYDDLSGSYAAGAAALWDGLVALPPQKRSLIATQIPNKNWMAARNGFDNDDDVDHQITHLPLKAGGDSMTFQFQIEQHFNVEAEPMDNYEYDYTGSGSNDKTNIVTGTSASAGHLPGDAVYDVEKRVINIVLTRVAPKDYPDVAGFSGSVPTRATILPVPISKSVNTLSTAVDTAQSAFDTASSTAEDSYAAWKSANAAHIAYVMYVREIAIADNKVNAAKEALTKALVDLSNNPSSLSMKLAADQANDKVEAAQSERNDIDPVSDDTSYATKLTTSKADAAEAAAKHRELVDAKIALAEGEAVLAQKIHTFNDEQAEYDAAYESAMDASGESGEIWTDASQNVAALESDLSDYVAVDLSGARHAAYLANSEAVTAAAAVDSAVQATVTRDINAKVDLAEKRAAFLAAKAEAEKQLNDLSGAVAVANLKLGAYALYYVYATGVDAAPTGPGASAVTAFYNARERSVPAIPTKLLDEDLAHAN